MTLFSKFTKSGGNTEKFIYPWSQRKLAGSNNALPRYGHGAAALDNQHFLIYGGIHKGNTKKNLFILDTNNLSATSLSTSGDVPSLRSFTTISSIGPFILLYGGEPIHANEMWDPYFYVMHTNTRQWSRVRTKGKFPLERAGHSTCVSDDGIMYIFGGHFQRKYLGDLCAFNVRDYPAKAEWDFINYENQGPAPRSGHISVIYDKKLYVFGGMNANHLFNDIWCFDLVACTWHQISAVGFIPAPRESCAAALVNDTIYIFGGRGLNGYSLGDLCAFRIKSQRWYMFQGMGTPPSPRYGLSMTVIGSKIYIFGGDSIAGKTDDSAYVYTLDCSKIKYPPESEASESKNSNVDRAMTTAIRDSSNSNATKSQHQMTETRVEQDLELPQVETNTNHLDHQHHSLKKDDKQIGSPTSAYSTESNWSHPSQSFDKEPSRSPPPRPPRGGVTLNDAHRQAASTMKDSFKFKRELAFKHRPQLPPKLFIPVISESIAKNLEEKAKLLLEIKARDAVILEMKTKERWWRTEVSVARHLQQDQHGNTCVDNEDIVLLDLEQKDKLLLFQQLVAVKAEIKKIRASVNKQNEPILEKIEQVESIRAVALEEAAYYKATYTALKSRDNGALDLLESGRADILETRLKLAYQEKDEINQKIHTINSQSQQDRSARLLAEERARDAQKQSEEAQEAHQNALENLTQLYEKIIKLEAQGRDDAMHIANLSSKLANYLSLSNTKDQDNSQLHIEIGRLEAANIKARNEIAILLKKLEESKDDENHLKMLLSDKDQAYAEAVLELEKTCIQLDILKNVSNNQTALTAVQ
ncbi:hypothetical protein [Parasitella parasitica]|uniref:Uncharacterized protein n=1 Tax=Parasitella parasitica TaxID=35722 RepID=A0A0B7NDE6_9FUNG|nr:hypothetical protein [Parasitella parasitica]